MRKDGGGLIFIMTSYTQAQKLQLPFLADVYEHIYTQYPVVKALAPNDLLYDTKSSFSRLDRRISKNRPYFAY